MPHESPAQQTNPAALLPAPEQLDAAGHCVLCAYIVAVAS